MTDVPFLAQIENQRIVRFLAVGVGHREKSVRIHLMPGIDVEHIGLQTDTEPRLEAAAQAEPELIPPSQGKPLDRLTNVRGGRRQLEVVADAGEDPTPVPFAGNDEHGGEGEGYSLRGRVTGRIGNRQTPEPGCPPNHLGFFGGAHRQRDSQRKDKQDDFFHWQVPSCR